MDTVVENTKSGMWTGLSRKLGRSWSTITNIGIDPAWPNKEIKQIKLLNGISAVVVLVYFFYILPYLNLRVKFVFFDCIAGMTFGITPIILNYYKRPFAARHFSCISNIVLYLFQSITAGGRDGVEYIFVLSCLTPILYFTELKPILIYYICNMLGFGLAMLSYTLMNPLFISDQQKYLNIANHTTMFVVLFFIVYYFKSENLKQENLLEANNVRIGEEKRKSDDLLLNILPRETAEELKETGIARTKSFELVTVMFTDFHDFTRIAQQMRAEDLVKEINTCFSYFDDIISKFSIEKIKTIGDAYMCASGLPQENPEHARDIILAAIEIQQYMGHRNNDKRTNHEPYFDIRIGINSGPVVAGIVGKKKFAYDIWGDTVNTASRMESACESGRINISGETFKLIHNEFRCEYRGKIAVKNRGDIDMYFVQNLPV